MVIATHTLAFILRIASYLLAICGMCPFLLKREVGPREHSLVLSGAACLMASGAIVAYDVSQALASVGIFLCAVIADALYCASARNAPHVFLPVAYLCCLGVAMMFDTNPGEAVRHAKFVAAGMVGCLILCWGSRALDDLLAASFPALLVLAVFLCALPLVPGLGVKANGAISWLVVGQHRLQPAEFAKVALALSLSAYLAANAWRVSHFSLSRGLLPICVVFGLALFLEIVENDLGTGLILLSLFAAMITMCSKRAGIVYALVLVACAFLLVYIAASVSSHVMERFVAWRDPYSDPMGVGYQRVKAIQAMENGGLVGTGLHFGRLLGFVPEVHTDYVFAAIVEELGIIGGSVTMLAVCALVAAATKSASSLPEASFERNVLVAGCSLVFCQSFVIIGGVTGVIPLTGVTLPFVSHGGSSLISCLGLIGLMGGCASSGSQRDANDFVLRRGLPAASVAIMALCVAAVAGNPQQLRLVGSTRRDMRAGNVVTADGVVLASSPDSSFRSYPEGSLAAHIIGEASSGIDERVCMARDEGVSSMLNVLALPDIAEDTVLTIDSRLQREAEAQLEGQTGAIVAMDSSSGALLAVASSPTYDASRGYEPEAGEEVSYLNRATQVLYAPGSTFKVVTMAAAIEGGYAAADSVYTGDPIELAQGGRVVNYGDAYYGDISLSEALTLSSNTAFAELALGMGEAPIMDMAERLGFNSGLGVEDFNLVASSYTPSSSDYSLAWGSVGQPTWEDGSETGPSATVLQMCSVMATIAADGVRRTPYLVASGPLAVSHENESAVMDEATANEIWEMMVESSGASLDGIEVAGKTGTAQLGDGTLCWYICAANGVSVACCIESGADGLGRDVARPRALCVLEEAVGITYAKTR